MNYKTLKAKQFGRVSPLVVIKNWLHQGFFYLDKTEMLYRVIWELIPLFVIFSILYFYIQINPFLSIFISVFIAHTLNWIFNDNLWTCLMFTFPSILNPGEKKTISYLGKMQKRLSSINCITGCMIYGSMSRGQWHIKSDLDMRILRRSGIFNGLLAYLVVHRERVIALFNAQPLDMYLVDDIKFLRKMRTDEFPIFLKNTDDRLIKEYGTNKTTDFSKVKNLNSINS